MSGKVNRLLRKMSTKVTVVKDKELRVVDKKHYKSNKELYISKKNSYNDLLDLYKNR